MTLNEIARHLSKDVYNVRDVDVTGLCYDSRHIKKGDLFFAIRGQHSDGHNYIRDVIDKGASGLIVQRRVDSSIPFIVVDDIFLAMSVIADYFYMQPSRRIPVIGVTGTNGKTTTTYLIETALKNMGKTAGVMGTISYRLGSDAQAAPNTTPFSIDVHQFLEKAFQKKADAVAMEVSSHALDQHRVDTVDFSVGVFTNLTQDHLDYHKDMETYFNAKARLFRDFKNIRAVINIDDSYGLRLSRECKNLLTYGITQFATIKAKNIIDDLTGLRFKMTMPSSKEVSINTNLMGRHNVFNLLGAAGALLSLGFDEKTVAQSLNGSHTIPGRLERVEAGQDFVVVVDYAHTEDALFQVLKTLRATNPKKMICVFGAGGDRDKTKRPKMGNVSTELADYVFVTSDNPRTENPSLILKDIEKGIVAHGRKNYELCEDRAEAIRRALNMARQGDIVLIAGKGHETYQIYGTTKIHFSDQETALEVLRK